MSGDTIFALSSGRPPAAIAVIRVSGPSAHEAAKTLAGSLPPARQAAVRTLRGEDGGLLDEALLLRFDGSASSTGEDLVEFHCHGGRAIVGAVLGSLESMRGLRAAQPGEFTRRAFENGRIDLTQAEGLADLIEAETESQRRAALAIAEGGLRDMVDRWQARLLELSVRAEAAIDYVEDDSVDGDPALSVDCGALADELAEWLRRPPAEPLREGVQIVIAGPPNSGKSSLLNAIVGYERAIVADLPGTTRDHIEVPIALWGIPMRLTDTAGLRESNEPVERIGVARARSLAERADILMWLGEPAGAPQHLNLLRVHSRADLAGRGTVPTGSIAVSSKTGAGLDALAKEIAEQARRLLPAEGEVALNRRQRECLSSARSSLRQAQDSVDVLIVAEMLRQARAAFDRMTGRAGVEDLLDALFGRFCLGK